MRSPFATISLAIALIAPIPAVAKTAVVSAPSLCEGCAAVAAAAAAEAKVETTSASDMSNVKDHRSPNAEPYRGPRTVPLFIARKAALLALFCGGKSK